MSGWFAVSTDVKVNFVELKKENLRKFSKEWSRASRERDENSKKIIHEMFPH